MMKRAQSQVAQKSAYEETVMTDWNPVSGSTVEQPVATCGQAIPSLIARLG